jgi:8-oxo-dGTP pyrophosphatase MutT (NUDIX family)
MTAADAEPPARPEVTLFGVLFDDAGRVLVCRYDRPEGAWTLPGGRLESGEDAPPGVRREVREETGLTVTRTRPVATTAWQADGDDRLGISYHCEWTDGPVSLGDEHRAFEWLPPADAAERLPHDDYAIAIERAEAARAAEDAREVER